MQGLIAELLNYLPVIVLLYFLFRFLLPEKKEGQDKILALKTQIINLRVANTLCTKKVGLLNHPTLSADCGLKLNGIRAIHTNGMAFAIDVLFIDNQKRVLQLDANVGAGRVIRGPRATKAVIELAAGVAARNEINVGDELTIYKKAVA